MSEEIYAISSEEDIIDNTDIKYDNARLFIKLNEKQNRFEERRYKLDISVKKLKKEYPELFAGCEDSEEIIHIIRNVFQEGFQMTCYITNLTFTSEKNKSIEIISLRPKKEGIYLTESLPDGVTLNFRGHVASGFFIIDEVRTGPDSDYRNFEIEAKVTPFHTNIPGGYRDTFLRKILDESESLTIYTEKKLDEWENFLEWRKAIAKRKIAGWKYYNVEFDHNKNLIYFDIVTEGEEEFKRFKKSARNVQAFNNAYSEDAWRFKFRENEKRGKIYSKGIILGRYRGIEDKNGHYINREEIINEFQIYESELEDVTLDYDEEDLYDEELEEEDLEESYVEEKINNSRNNMIEILKNFKKPYIARVRYSLNDDDLNEIDKFLSDSEKKEYIQNNLMNDFDKDGFLALSGVGEFVLLKRLDNSIKLLKRDENNSPNLALWLFNIEKANLPTSKTQISKWLSDSIQTNADQMKAVEKMLDAPDICLIQGPPGTGKTTVIAEAVYQFAIRGKRILIASQSNDAVDNALERLECSSDIRAIRLGQKNRKKRLKDEKIVNKFSEENAIETFYKSISSNIDKEYLNVWNSIEKNSVIYATDLREINGFLEQEIKEKQYLREIDRKCDRLIKESLELKNKIENIETNNENIRLIEIQLEGLKSYINGEDSEFILQGEQIGYILKHISQQINKVEEFGVVLLVSKDLDLDNESSNKLNTKILKIAIENLNVLIKLSEKIKNSKKDLGRNNEVTLIDFEIKKLEMKISEIEDPEEFKEIRLKQKKLKSKKSNILDRENRIYITAEEKNILTDKLLDEFDNMEILKLKETFEIIDKNIISLKNELDKSVRELENNNFEKFRETENFENKYLEINSQLKKIKYEKEQRIDKLKNLKENYKKLLNKYNANEENIESKIKELIAINEKKSKESKLIRNDFENILRDFKARLDNKDEYGYDREFYGDIYLDSCNVIGISCTDNMNELSERYNDFDVVIIDEVSKATPPELLIPLMKARKAILVGDHRQLPPLFNEHEKTYGEIVESIDEENENQDVVNLLTKDNFNRFKYMVTASLFKEYFENADQSIKHSLFTQYRMHSDIMKIINRFYEGRLENGISKEDENSIKNHGLKIKGKDNMSFVKPEKHAYWIDSSRLPNGEDRFYESRPIGSTSAENILECFIIINLLKEIADEYRKQGRNKENRVSIGIISFYQLQVNRIRELFNKERKNFDFSPIEVDINTVDRFQGKEKEIIITSLVRNVKNVKKSKSSHIAAFERINVAFSRAKNLLFIVGAKDMYAEQEVTLPNMETKGQKTVHVYKNIIEELNRNACYFGSEKLLGEEDINRLEIFMKEAYK